MANPLEFHRTNFVATLCARDAPRIARARKIAGGPYTHNQNRHAGLPIVLHTERAGYRAGKGRQVAFFDEPDYRVERVTFRDSGGVVTEVSLVPTEADLQPFAEFVIAFLYENVLPDLRAYKA